MANRPHPHVSIPASAAPPANTSPSSSWTSYLHSSLPPQSSSAWTDHASSVYSSAASATIPRISLEDTSRPPSRATSYYDHDSNHTTAPESSHLFRSASQRSTLRPSPTTVHRATRSELTVGTRHPTGESRPPSFISTESSPELAYHELSDELSNLTLQSEEGLHRFQSGQLADSDCEWYRLAPPEARKVLDKQEVQRQSILFEIIKSERDYVDDLRLIREIFIEPLINTAPMPRHRLDAFISEVFNNIDQIRAHHERMRDALFARQLEQHPLIQSIADIILDHVLDPKQSFITDYEENVKHYPLAKARHHAELNRNTKYQYFIQQCYLDPRMHKRDLPSMLYRVVTRLQRLRLQLQTAMAHTAPDHPDIDAIPPVLDVVSGLLKSTEPGVAVSVGKVEFWELCESLVYQRGEIIDLDLYDDSRTLIHQGSLARRYRSDMGYAWADLQVALLDNYLLLLKFELRGTVKKHAVISRPIPLEYLRLATFSSPPEKRPDEGGFIDRIFSNGPPWYPFTIYHASAKMSRRYTLYAPSDDRRQEWHAILVDALGVRKVQQEANMWFAPHVVNEDRFKYSNSMLLSSVSSVTGKINTAAQFSSGSKNYIAVACQSGIYVAARGSADFRRVLGLSNTTGMVPLTDFNKMIVLSDQGLATYSLDVLARAYLGIASQYHVEATMEQVAGEDSTVLFFRAGKLGSRTMILYTSRRMLQVYFYALEVIPGVDANAIPRRSVSGAGSMGAVRYRPFGEPLAVPKDTHDITSLHKSAGLCTDKGIWIVDPTNPSTSSANPIIIPKFSGAESNPPMSTLKTRCASAKPLGLVRCEREEILVIYDELGCYLNKHGIPTRSCGYLRWESKASTFAHRGDHILLFSPEFIEVRTVQTGKLVQVIEGDDIRLAYRGLLPDDKAVLVAMKGKEEHGTVNDKIIELVETAEIITPTTGSVPAMWDEWDIP